MGLCAEREGVLVMKNVSCAWLETIASEDWSANACNVSALAYTGALPVSA